MKSVFHPILQDFSVLESCLGQLKAVDVSSHRHIKTPVANPMDDKLDLDDDFSKTFSDIRITNP
nr:hypothetical protein [uncultured Desulfobacter sp.]